LTTVAPELKVTQFSPEPEGAEKPVGMIYLGVATGGGGHTERHIFPGDRDGIRRAAMIRALEMLSAEAR